MLSQLSARMPIFLRVILTAASAFGFVTVASGLIAFSAGPAVALPAASSLAAGVSDASALQDAASSARMHAVQAQNAINAAHSQHMAHAAHMQVLAQAAAEAKAAAQAAAQAREQAAAQAKAATPPPAPQLSTATVSTAGFGSFQACVIARESGGNPQVMNSTGHYGLYQFSASTWAAYGGNPADFGHASVAEQNQVFANAMAAGGESNWAPYDGC